MLLWLLTPLWDWYRSLRDQFSCNFTNILIKNVWEIKLALTKQTVSGWQTLFGYFIWVLRNFWNTHTQTYTVETEIINHNTCLWNSAWENKGKMNGFKCCMSRQAPAASCYKMSCYSSKWHISLLNHSKLLFLRQTSALMSQPGSKTTSSTLCVCMCVCAEDIETFDCKTY